MRTATRKAELAMTHVRTQYFLALWSLWVRRSREAHWLVASPVFQMVGSVDQASIPLTRAHSYATPPVLFAIILPAIGAALGMVEGMVEGMSPLHCPVCRASRWKTLSLGCTVRMA